MKNAYNGVMTGTDFVPILINHVLPCDRITTKAHPNTLPGKNQHLNGMSLLHIDLDNKTSKYRLH